MKTIYCLPALLMAFSAWQLKAQTMYENFKPMAAAKLYFSDKPFASGHEGAKTSFTSSEPIYGRLELDGQTIEAAFKTNTITTRYPYLRLRVGSFKGDKQLGRCNNWTYLLLKAEDVKKGWLNFDILPAPDQSTSALSGTDDFSSGLAAGPLYHIIGQDAFPKDDAYTIWVQLYLPARNAYGSLEDDEKWPVAESSFQLNFSTADVARLKANAEAADNRVSKNTFKLSAMPEWFSNSTTVSDPKLTNANIATILKRDLPKRSMELIKFNVAKYTGSLWMIEKNDLGIIERRYVNPDINIAYRYDGQCYLGTARLWEEYAGGGKYGPLMVGAGTCNSCGQIIDCTAIK